MRGIDMLARACAPEEPTQAAAQPQALTDDQCKKIASMVLEQLQGSQQKSEEPEPEGQQAEPEPEPQEGESIDEA